ncbi:stage II sporulation protein M [Cerasicoccus maritimus]|uniref:stage II sporulation protein M n=1 Tax=Cerasicoccus maritimus TaxID=490089 RepID=UPI002852816A|nr:stage II sporulation protein M [Cerasicoccus maritimus]
MIIDLKRFISARRAEWDECERTLTRLENNPKLRLGLDEAQRFHYLLERVAADLNQINTAAADPATRAYLESLLARGYSEVQETQRLPVLRTMANWLMLTFPQTVRRHFGALKLALAAFLLGSLFGAMALMLDVEAKPTIIGFDHLMGSPSERVAEEEANRGANMSDGKTTFSAMLMTHNIKVSMYTLAWGITFGIGTIINLFYNGVILGAVGMDYMLAGETKFLIGWLLPHGSIEIPAIILAGQAGLVLGKALLFRDGDKGLVTRMREVRGDLLTLMGGIAVMLVWAGLVEAFFSQYHEPVLPYSVKIIFGSLELVGLIAFLMFAGRRRQVDRENEGLPA